MPTEDQYLELRIIDRHIQEIQKQLQIVEEQLMEFAYIKQSIESMQNVAKDTNLLVPVSNGIFAEAKLADTEHLLVNVGAGVVVKKTTEDALSLMNDQQQEMAAIKLNLETTMQKLVDKAIDLDQQLQNV
jgi:prefoldin alpha subunit